MTNKLDTERTLVRGGDGRHFTVWEVGLTEVQVVAGPGRVVLGAHRELHALDVLLEVVEGSEDVLYPVHAHAVHAVVGHRLVSLHVRLSPRSPGGVLNGQRLDDVTRWTLERKGERSRLHSFYSWLMKIYHLLLFIRYFLIILLFKYFLIVIVKR